MLVAPRGARARRPARGRRVRRRPALVVRDRRAPRRARRRRSSQRDCTARSSRAASSSGSLARQSLRRLRRPRRRRNAALAAHRLSSRVSAVRCDVSSLAGVTASTDLRDAARQACRAHCKRQLRNLRPALEAPDGITAAALRAEAWAGEPFLHPDEDPDVALAPGTASRRALDAALAEIEAGLREPSPEWRVELRAHARPRPRPLGEAAAPRLRHRAAPPSGGRARRDADRADRGEPEAGRERQRERRRRSLERDRRGGRRGGRGRARARRRRARTVEADEDEDEVATGGRSDPGASRRFRFRHPTASGKTIAAAGFVEAARTEGVLILTHRRLLVDQFRRDLTDGGYADRFTDIDPRGRHADLAAEPDHDPDLRLVRAPRRRDLAHRVPARDLRRGAHRARREDLGGDPQPQRADLRRHDGDRAADREAGLRRLPGLGRRPAARRRRPPRADRAAALPARAAGRGDQLGADRRRRLRGARARRRRSTTRR